MSSPSYDVIVVGGGIVGLSAAIAMNQRGFSVALLDAGSLTVDTAGIDSRVYAINNASQSLLQTLGAWDYLDKTRVSPYNHMHVWDAANAAHIDLDARMVGMDRLGTILEESIIKEALLKCISQQAIHMFPDSKVVEVQANSEAVCLKDANSAWQAKLLIIADGAASVTRQLLGVAVTSWPYHQQAIVTTVHTEKPHERTAYQVFNQDGPLAFLPLADAHQCSIVWSTISTRAEKLLNLHEEKFAEQITNAFAAKLGQCTVMGKRYQFPLHMRHAKQYCGARWLLMGDAAHTIHPMAGLGLNVGLADLAAWNKSLDMNQDKRWSSRMLNTYQRERKYHVWQMIALMEGLKMAFSNPLSPATMLRGLGLRVFNSVLPLKKLVIGKAANV
jgi:2-octaprenylphenol hydroxylase